MEVLLLVDGDNLWWRSYHALRGRMGDEGGPPTWAVHGTVTSIAWFVRRYTPTHLLVAFDGGASAHRRALFPEYKSGRAPLPGSDPASDFALARAEKDRCRTLLSLMGMAVQRDEGVEADDVIAEAVHRCGASSTLILSGDKDMRQLVGPTVSVLEPSHSHGTDERIWDEAEVEAEYGVPAHRLAELLALTGDTSDGVPGVKGIGPKKAAKILSEHSSLEEAVASDPRLAEHAQTVGLAFLLVWLHPGIASWDWTPERLVWDPVQPGDVLASPLEELMGRIGLERIHEQWLDGRLWQEQPRIGMSLADALAARR